LQFSHGARQGKVQALDAQPTPVFALGWQTVWQAPQCSGLCSETQTKLSGRPSVPGQHAGVAPSQGAPALPQRQVPTHRFVAVREQVSSQPWPQCLASASYGGRPTSALQLPSVPLKHTRVPATHIARLASGTPHGLVAPSWQPTESAKACCVVAVPFVTWTTKGAEGATTSSGLPVSRPVLSPTLSHASDEGSWGRLQESGPLPRSTSRTTFRSW
jgi:hypothetical protein